MRGSKALNDDADAAMLPKAVGGDAVTVGEDGEEDERCSKGAKHSSLATMLRELEG